MRIQANVKELDHTECNICIKTPSHKMLSKISRSNFEAFQFKLVVQNSTSLTIEAQGSIRYALSLSWPWSERVNVEFDYLPVGKIVWDLFCQLWLATAQHTSWVTFEFVLQFNAPSNRKVVKFVAFDIFHSFKKLLAKTTFRKTESSSAPTFLDALVIIPAT